MKALSDFLYYHEPGPPDIKIYCGDCLEIMPLLDHVDLVVTDPPYGVNLNYDQYQDTEANWYALMDKLIPLVRSKSTMSIMPSCQIKRLEWIYRNHPPDWLLCWYKGSPGHVGYMGFNDWEPHLVYGKNSTTVHDYFHATPEPQTRHGLIRFYFRGLWSVLGLEFPKRDEYPLTRRCYEENCL